MTLTAKRPQQFRGLTSTKLVYESTQHNYNSSENKSNVETLRKLQKIAIKTSFIDDNKKKTIKQPHISKKAQVKLTDEAFVKMKDIRKSSNTAKERQMLEEAMLQSRTLEKFVQADDPVSFLPDTTDVHDVKDDPHPEAVQYWS